jgi:fucose permease
MMGIKGNRQTKQSREKGGRGVITTVVTVAGALVFGMILALLSDLKRALAIRLDLGQGRVSSLLVTLNLGLALAMVLTGVLVDRWSSRGVMITGSVLLALAVMSLGERPTYKRTMLALIGAGVGAAAICTATVTLMPWAFFRPDHLLASLQFGHACIALGALITPPLTTLLVGILGLRKTAALLAILCLVPAFLAALPGAREMNQFHRSPEWTGLLTMPTLWVAGLLALVYAPLEASVSTWVVHSQTDPEQRQPNPQADQRVRWILFGFWGAFVASRLAAVWMHEVGLLQEAWDSWLLLLLTVLVLVALGNLASLTSRASAFVGVLALGFLLGPLFPALVGILFRQFKAEWGTTYGLLFASGSLGSLLMARFVPMQPRKPTTLALGPILLAVGLTLLSLVYVMVLSP